MSSNSAVTRTASALAEVTDTIQRVLDCISAHSRGMSWLLDEIPRLREQKGDITVGYVLLSGILEPLRRPRESAPLHTPIVPSFLFLVQLDAGIANADMNHILRRIPSSTTNDPYILYMLMSLVSASLDKLLTTLDMMSREMRLSDPIRDLTWEPTKV
ncbi:hypothetical protein BDV25DRAFT_135093 [Aspergillus avenaceus]|uniref:Uncharacterized protein n=1 Tax=Aspergillus avenaceus TaxID=36643 RepID=A0A5N6U9Q1_ASPAV|nr:hypothetical protein BDV25DRAFT_135093 [Aspergillus avenaceus]